jgi:hypothetical protein
MKSEIVKEICADLERREGKGLKEYGCTVDRTDLTRLEWLQHLYEELLDSAVYTKKLINLEKHEQ